MHQQRFFPIKHLMNGESIVVWHPYDVGSYQNIFKIHYLYILALAFDHGFARV